MGPPALDKEMNEFTEEAGTTRWYLYNIDRETILEEPGEIVTSIRSTPETPRRCTTEEKMLVPPIYLIRGASRTPTGPPALVMAPSSL